MRNHILTNLFVVLMIFNIPINNKFNVNAETNINAMLKSAINDKKLIARQTGPTEISCSSVVTDNIRKSTDSDIDVPKDTIFVKFNMECNIKTIKVAVASYSLEKFDTDSQWVGMTGVSMKQLGSIGVPKNIGLFIINSYLITASPSECLDAPNDGIGVLAKAGICFTFDNPPGYTTTLSQPCAKTVNIIDDCPPNSIVPPGGVPLPPNLPPGTPPPPGKLPGGAPPAPDEPSGGTPPTPDEPSGEVPAPELPNPPQSPDSNPYCYYNYTPTSTSTFNTITSSIPSPSLLCINSSSSFSSSSLPFLTSFFIVFYFFFLL
ncbi:hypothetical protein RclHR1_14530001 [Rhizophagus clarus]|uniref:Protein diaphanous homolog 1 isoform X1 n=1 Tax=Rhizophagus clarus TaxID=94130 RepID=A0A2Z6QCY4_9GLOM|nr:hypothetical protein RclHR1_14530001 [Rhizophagus clarus]GET04050.1 protein diaphanous homolog 1 isoform X1 [Rhizophagus clarus]